MLDWYAYDAVHLDIKSHMGDVLTMDKGSTQNISLKQNINRKRSTEE